VTTIRANFVERSVVSAITQTPASARRPGDHTADVVGVDGHHSAGRLLGPASPSSRHLRAIATATTVSHSVFFVVVIAPSFQSVHHSPLPLRAR